MIKANKAKQKIYIEGESNVILDEIGTVISAFLKDCAKRNEETYRDHFNVLLFALASCASDIRKEFGYDITNNDLDRFNPFDLDMRKGDNRRG